MTRRPFALLVLLLTAVVAGCGTPGVVAWPTFE